MICKIRYIQTTFFLCIYFFASIVTLGSVTAQELLTIDNVRVDVSAENALKARDEAFIEAQKKAFARISERFTGHAPEEILPSLDPAIISPMIKDYEVTNERVSSTRYIGTYTFRFSENAIKSHFGARNFSNANNNLQASPVLVLPFYEADGKTMLWSSENPWMNAWQTSTDITGHVPIVLPLGDLEDVREISETNPLQFTPNAIDNLNMRYRSQDIIAAIAKPDNNDQLVIYLYHIQSPQPVFIQQLTVAPPEDQQSSEAIHDPKHTNETTILTQGVRMVFRAMQKNWKSTLNNQETASSRQALKVQAVFKNLREWTQIQQALRQTKTIESVIVTSVTPRYAVLDITFQGTENRFILALQQANLMLSNTKPSREMFMNPSGMVSTEAPVYQISLQRNGFSR